MNNITLEIDETNEDKDLLQHGSIIVLFILIFCIFCISCVVYVGRCLTRRKYKQVPMSAFIYEPNNI